MLNNFIQTTCKENSNNTKLNFLQTLIFSETDLIFQFLK